MARKRSCSDCAVESSKSKGTGICQECIGQGDLLIDGESQTCPVCEGSGKCPACVGTGEEISRIRLRQVEGIFGKEIYYRGFLFP